MKIRIITNFQTGKRDMLHIYSGFDTFEALIDFTTHTLHLDKKHIAVVCFSNSYYGIVYDGIHKRAVIGAKYVWYQDGDKIERKREDVKELPYTISKLTRQQTPDDSFVQRLEQLDKHSTVSVYRHGKFQEVNYLYHTTYLKMLWSTFHKPFYLRDDPNQRAF